MTTPSRRRILLVANPNSGSGDSGLPQFVQRLKEGGAEVVERGLSPDTALSEYLKDLEGFDCLVAAGGDGTVSSLAYAARYKNVPLLAYPAGTANLIAQNLALKPDPERLAQVVEEGQPIQIDLGELEIAGEKRGFAMLAGAGLDARMIAESEDLKENLGVMSYVVGLFRNLNPKTTTFRLTIDGQPRTFEGAAVMAANFGRANYRIPIAPGISPNDGRFTVLLVKGGNLLSLVPNLIDSLRAKLNLGDPVFEGNFETLEAKEIRVETDEPFPVQYDGESLEETTPFTVRMLPSAISFLMDKPEEKVQT